MKLISVVIPIYDAERYLEKTLERVCCQTYKNIEIILVDDGSRDNSLNICNEYARKDSRVKVYSIDNSGPAHARKFGTQVATGEYITYVDADDLPGEELIEKLASRMKNKIEMVTSGFVEQQEDLSEREVYDGVLAGTYITEKKKKTIYKQIMMNINMQRDGVLPYQWGKLFKTNVAIKVYDEVDEEICVGEDREFTRRYILECKGICITDICEYYKQFKADSMSRVNSEYFIINYFRNYISLKKVFELHKESKHLVSSLNHWIYDLVIREFQRGGVLQSVKFISYFMPLSVNLQNKRIILYGAGNVGKSVFFQLNRMGTAPILWVDKHYRKYHDLAEKVNSIRLISKFEYDYIIVAVALPYVMEDIKKELIKMNVPKEKIIWQRPVPVVEGM